MLIRSIQIIIVLVLIITSSTLYSQNSLPSCVITTPHCNAYYQEGTDILIRVYSTDIGGTYSGGSVSKVEFFNGSIKLGEATSSVSNTYSFTWKKVPAGEYTIIAKATDNSNSVATSAGVIITVGSAPVKILGLSSGKGKYLANIIPSSVRSDFNNYWNGVTAENSCKWGSVEGTRNVMNWTQADRAYNHAKSNNMPFRYHAIAWGSQYPQWITSLSQTDFKKEIEEYMAAIAARYPLIDQIDVLNENMYINSYNKQEHAAGTPYFRAGMGGPGVTGYDWMIWLFEKARFYFPNSKLVMNDFELESNLAGLNEMLAGVKVLRDRGLIDGFGTQAHHFNLDGLSGSALQTSLNNMAKSGVPVYVTELDLKGKPESAANQSFSYSTLFPVYWDHPAVAGITLWGYVEGSTWSTGTGILNSNGTERAAMTWLKNYMEGRPEVGYPFASKIVEPTNENLIKNGEFDSGIIPWEIGSFNTGYGTTSIVQNAGLSGSNALKICPSEPGIANWEVQVLQYLPITSGKTYEISFTAKADANRSFTLAMQKNAEPYTMYLDKVVNLTTTAQNFNLQFKASTTDDTNRIKFFVGLDTKCLYIDNVVVKEVLSTGINKLSTKHDISVWPNPVNSGKLNIENKQGKQIKSIVFFDLNGKLIKTEYPDNNSVSLDLSGFKKGIYILKINYGDAVVTEKIAVQ